MGWRYALVAAMVGVMGQQVGAEGAWRPVNPDNLVLLETTTGTVAIELAPDAAPQHVAQFRKAVRSGVFENEYFYRVVEGHVAQAGLEFDQRLGDWPELPMGSCRSEMRTCSPPRPDIATGLRRAGRATRNGC